MPPFIQNIYIALLFSIYSTAVFAVIKKRSKKLIYIVAGVQFVLWTVLNFCQLPIVLGLLLFLSMFLVFGLSAKGLAVLFSDKAEKQNNS
ncbi:MAG: hypothetical protein PHV82_18610 [Victivallaceae bacterium]|nr:hypothetical protein [Victivallaceae bacterium]